MDPKSQKGTYIFLGLRSTGIPGTPGGIRITEISMIAVKRAHLLQSNKAGHKEPRVQNKLVMCFYPQKKIDAATAKKTGLNNSLLKYENLFDMEAFNVMRPFINSQEKPICLVSHYGFKLHFKLLQYQLKKLKVTLPERTVVADSLYAFFDILHAKGEPKNDGVESCKPMSVRKVPNRGGESYKKLWRHRYYGDSRPKESYRLTDIYDRVVGAPKIVGNKAENSSILMMRIATKLGENFDSWVVNHKCPFDDIPKTIMKKKQAVVMQKS